MNPIFVRARSLVLRILRIPPDPSPPAGALGSLRVFRAGRNYYRLRFWIWAIKHALALVAFLVTLFVLHQALHSGFDSVHRRLVAKGKRQAAAAMDHAESYVWLLPVFECLGFGFAFLQLPFSYALIRLDYEQRWYLVTDRSLRLRYGLWNVREMTLSFANVQQITLRQGPVQRLLGLGDLVVTTAGGGSLPTGEHGRVQTPWHSGILHSVDNAEEIRDLIQKRLRLLKTAGLGDADDPEPSHPLDGTRPGFSPPCGVASGETLVAARELLEEIRAFRRELTVE